MDQICQHFGISKSTIRRDLEQILQNGNIKKIYGGVTVQSKKELISFHERNIAHLAEEGAHRQEGGGDGFRRGHHLHRLGHHHFA